MKTTEVFVDQVLIGFMVIAVFLLPFRELCAKFLALDSAKYVGVTGIAYLIGILFDRFANTLLDGIERRHRLDYAWDPPTGAGAMPDPFPEERIIVGLGIDALSSDWIHYLRSRIRLSRATAAFLPALTLSAALYIQNSVDKSSAHRSEAMLAVVSLFYAVGYVASEFDWPVKLPKTWQRDEKHGRLGRHQWDPKTRKCWCQTWWCDPTLLVGFVPFGLVFVLAVWQSKANTAVSEELVVIDLCGLGLSVLAMHIWLKIRGTLMRFLNDNALARPPAKNADEAFITM